MQIKSQLSSENSLQRFSLIASRSSLRWATVVFIFALAFAIRVYNLASPGALAPDREFRSALIARSYYFKMTDSVPDWRRDVALATEKRAGLIEPPVMELLTASIYRILNGVHLWIARLLASIFWLIGGVFLFKVAERLVSFEAAVVSTAYYLFVPLGVLASRTFQPDSLMIMLFLVSILAIVRYAEQQTTSRLVVAAFISGITILIRPLVLFALLGAFISLTIVRKFALLDFFRGSKVDESGMKAKISKLYEDFQTNGGLKWVFDAQFLIYIVASLLPAVLFYGYGLLFNDALKGQAAIKFLPQLLLLPAYWKGWIQTAADAVGRTALIAGLVGLLVVRRGLPRFLLIGLWIGYVLFGLVFQIQIHLVDYYHLQFIVIVALSIGPVVALIINHAWPSLNQWYWQVPFVAVLTLLVLFNFRDMQRRLATRQWGYSEAVAQEIGEIVGHSQNTVYLAHHYGTPLEYYGELSGTWWPKALREQDQILGRLDAPGRAIEERFQALGYSPEYFIITDFAQLDRNHADLKEYLINNCQLVAESNQYLIYEDCKT